jgi:toxin ParE1/3/4
MNRPIVKSPLAYRDIVDIASHIAEDSIKASERFLEAAEGTFDRLATTPEIGSLCPFKNPATAGVRVWPIRRFNRYLVFYRLESKGIYVVRIMHGARDWQSLFEGHSDD